MLFRSNDTATTEIYTRKDTLSLPTLFRSVYHPRWPEWCLTIGTFGFFFMMFLLFCKFLPVVAITEKKEEVH